MIIVGSVLVAVGLIVGTILVLLGTKDYSAYTARANGTVVNVEVHTRRDSKGRTSTTRDYDVRVTADGRTVRINGIGGVHLGENNTGDVVTVAFPPGQPEKAIWASTLEGGQRILLFIGLGIGLLFGGLGAVILILGLRRRSAPSAQVDLGSGVTGPTLADPGAAQDIGRPWTFDELVGGLARTCAGTPYTVDRSGESVTVRINLADNRWWALLQRQGLKKSYSTTLTPVGPAKVARSDSHGEVEWAAGANGQLTPMASGRMSNSGGRSWSVGSGQVWALGPSGVEKVVDYQLNSGELQALVAATLKRAGWSTALDTQTRIGLWVAGTAVAGAAVTVVAVLVF